jgi:hypothetical protein
VSGRLRLALCVAAIACCAGLGWAGTASAHTGCGSGWFCNWEDNGFVTNGCPSCDFNFQTYSHDYGAHNFEFTSINAADKTSSYANHGNSLSVRLYKGSWYSGQFSGPKPPTTHVGDMVDDWNDEVESACFLSGGCIG